MKFFKSILLIITLVVLIYEQKPGDINRDGKVTATDLVQLRQMVEGDRSKSGRADLNGDGSIDQIDLQILRERLAGK